MIYYLPYNLKIKPILIEVNRPKRANSYQQIKTIKSNFNSMTHAFQGISNSSIIINLMK